LTTYDARTARADLQPEALQFVILKEAGNTACLKRVEGLLRDFSGGHDEPHVQKSNHETEIGGGMRQRDSY